jgi:glycosyltransferase involved in cell wall biosynthesis
VQEQWLSTFYARPDLGIEECRTQLLQFCRSVTFLRIDSLARPFGKIRTALESLLPGYCYSVRWLQSRDARELLHEMGLANHYDIAHFDTIGLAPYRNCFRRVPASLGHHNIESHMFLRRAANEPSLPRKLYFYQEGLRLRGFERRVAQDFSVHITCSELDSERLREVAPDCNAIAVPNGVDTTYFQPGGEPVRPRSCIFVGSLNWYPNADAIEYFLRDVWPQLQRRVAGITLDIVGSGPSERIRSLASSFDNVRVHGFVDDVRPMMDTAAVYVCPIRDGGGTKLKLLDAFAMRKCVIAHPIACEGIAVTPGVDVLQAASADDFIGQIARALDDEALRERVASAARELVVTRYSFASIGVQLQEIFVECASAAREGSSR